MTLSHLYSTADRTTGEPRHLICYGIHSVQDYSSTRRERRREGGTKGLCAGGRKYIHCRVEQAVSAGLVSSYRWPVPSLAQVLAAAVVRWPFQEPVSPRMAKGQSPGGRLPCSCSLPLFFPTTDTTWCQTSFELCQCHMVSH